MNKIIFIAFSLITIFVALIFSFMVFKQYIERRRYHQLWWSIALLTFSFAAFTEMYSEVYGWTVTIYKLYYVSAAILVALLGLGSVYLIFKERTGHVCAGILVISSLAFITITLKADVFVNALKTGVSIGGKAMPTHVRIFSPLFTIPGSIALFGGAIYSALKFKNPKYRYRVVANYYIAAGTLVIAAAGGVAKAGFTSALHPSELIGIILLFTGFLKAGTVTKK